MFSLQDFMEDEDRALSDLVESIMSTSQGRRRGLGRDVRCRGARTDTSVSRQGDARCRPAEPRSASLASGTAAS